MHVPEKYGFRAECLSLYAVTPRTSNRKSLTKELVLQKKTFFILVLTGRDSKVWSVCSAGSEASLPKPDVCALPACGRENAAHPGYSADSLVKLASLSAFG